MRAVKRATRKALILLAFPFFFIQYNGWLKAWVDINLTFNIYFIILYKLTIDDI
jgi:hypothetical protein